MPGFIPISAAEAGPFPVPSRQIIDDINAGLDDSEQVLAWTYHKIPSKDPGRWNADGWIIITSVGSFRVDFNTGLTSKSTAYYELP